MPFSVPTSEPEFLTAGESWQWTRASSEFPPSEGWALTYYLTGAYSLSLVTTPSVPNNNYAVHALPATTNPVTAGIYKWVLRASLAGDVYDVDSGEFSVLANPNITTGTDARAHAEQMVTLLESEIKLRLSGQTGAAADGSGHNAYSIEGRSISKFTLTELKTLRGQYLREIAIIRGGGSLPPIEIGFGGISSTSSPESQWFDQ